MIQSDDITNLAAAFALAQPKIEGAIKDKTNPHFRSQYADLGNVVDAIKPALAENGLSFIQRCHDTDAGAKVETIILHSSGQWLSCGVLFVPATKADAQGFGSALTYARRYSLSAAFGVAPEDDDGNAASKTKAPKGSPAEIKDDAYSELDEAGKDWINGLAVDVVFLLEKEGAEQANQHIKEMLGNPPNLIELRNALWHRLDSKTRSALKAKP
jgi:hypothetical protein